MPPQYILLSTNVSITSYIHIFLSFQDGDIQCNSYTEFRVLRRVFGPKTDEVTGEWRKLHNELNDLYSLPNIVRVVKSRRMRWTGHVARMGEGRGVHRVLVGKPEGKRPFGRPRRRWEDNVNTLRTGDANLRFFCVFALQL
jgi:hypothetical protein